MKGMPSLKTAPPLSTPLRLVLLYSAMRPAS
jgi:hypothetical protein